MTNQELSTLALLEAPFINAAGTLTGPSQEAIINRTDTLVATGLGALTFGSFTVPAQEGNAKRYGSPTYTHNAITGETYNSEGLPNIGKEAAVAMAPEVVMRAHDQGKAVIYSASPTNSPRHGDSVAQALDLVEAFLETDVDLVELNVSCPNVVTDGGGRKPIMGYDLETIARLVDGLEARVGEGQRLGIKLPPYVSEEEQALIPDLARLLRGSDALNMSVAETISAPVPARYRVFNFLVAANTIPNQIARHPDGTPILSVPKGLGGLSGPATKEVGRQQLKLWREQMGPSMDIVSALGVDSGQEIGVRLSLGAVAAEAATLLTESRNWPATISSVLQEYAYTVE